MTHELPDESNQARDYHIELINEHANHIIDNAQHPETIEIALQVAEQQLGEIKPQEG